MNHFNDIAVFSAVAETKAFAAAARKLGLSTSGVSKSINRLEGRLAVRLFTRTTRRVALTAEGEHFHARARDILEALAEAESELKDSTASVSGRIKIDMPLMFGERHVLPLLTQFRTLNPDVYFDMRFSDTISNLVEDNIDLAIRFGELADSNIKAVRLGHSRLVTCAAPKYLSKFQTPKKISDLDEHACINFQFPATAKIYRWRFIEKKQDISYLPRLQNTVNDVAAYHRLAVLGEGIIQNIDSILFDELSRGQLVEILKPFSAKAFPLAIVWPAGRYQPKRLRALIDFLTPRLKAVMSKTV